MGGDNLLDVMEPNRLESEVWISPTNYNFLVDKLCTAPAAAALTESNLPQAGSDNLVISGTVSNTTPATGTLDPLFRLSTAPTTTPLAGSQYCVNLEDASGGLLNGYCFNESFDVDSNTPASAESFNMLVPDPPGLHRVELTQTSSSGAVVLSSQTVSAHSPTVTVTYPNVASLDPQWKPNDHLDRRGPGPQSLDLRCALQPRQRRNLAGYRRGYYRNELLCRFLKPARYTGRAWPDRGDGIRRFLFGPGHIEQSVHSGQ